MDFPFGESGFGQWQDFLFWESGSGKRQLDCQGDSERNLTGIWLMAFVAKPFSLFRSGRRIEILYFCRNLRMWENGNLWSEQSDYWILDMMLQSGILAAVAEGGEEFVEMYDSHQISSCWQIFPRLTDPCSILAIWKWLSRQQSRIGFLRKLWSPILGIWIWPVAAGLVRRFREKFGRNLAYGVCC